MAAPLCPLITVLLFLFCASPACPAAQPHSPLLEGRTLDQAIRIGSGPHQVLEFSDPDCRFSRRMARYWRMRHDVTRYIFLVTLKNHPDAPQKARYILSAPNRQAAYESVFEGALDFDDDLSQHRYDDRGLLERHRAVAAKLGVVGTPTYFVDGVKVVGAKVREIERLLGGERIPFDPADPE